MEDAGTSGKDTNHLGVGASALMFIGNFCARQKVFKDDSGQRSKRNKCSCLSCLNHQIYIMSISFVVAVCYGHGAVEPSSFSGYENKHL